MNHLAMHAVIVHPLWPARAESAPPAGLSPWLWAALAGVLIFAVAGAVSYLAWRDRRRSAPVERAFRSLASRLRVPHASAQLLRVIADDQDVPPVALLLSERAYDRAVAASVRQIDPAVFAALRHRLFAGA